MELSKKLDSLLEEVVSIAYSKDYGYLTCCPTNVGTGLRASVMLHLPALTMTGYINNILTACNKLGLTVRGMFGENSEAAGSIYQVSNQVTLGLDEQEILLNVANMTKQIIDSERSIRTELYTQNPNRFEDRIYRSYGVFSNARVLTSNESLRLISDIRLGVEMGILKDIGLEIINELMLLIQPASLQKLAGKPLGAEERDIRRAEAVRERLGKS